MIMNLHSACTASTVEVVSGAQFFVGLLPLVMGLIEVLSLLGAGFDGKSVVGVACFLAFWYDFLFFVRDYGCERNTFWGFAGFFFA